MGHLNELNEKYAAKGLQVIAITNEPRGLVDKFIEETGATHPVVIESSDSATDWGISGFPSMFVVGPDGTILHKGVPSDAQIEEWLKDAKPFPEAPKSLSKVVKSIEKSDYTKALGDLDKFLEKEGNPEEDVTAATEIRDWLLWQASSGLDGAAAAAESGDYYRAAKTYEDLTNSFKGHETGDKAAESLKELLADKERKREVDAGEKLADARVKQRDLSPKKALKLFETLAKRYEGTKAGEEARKIAVRLANQR